MGTLRIVWELEKAAVRGQLGYRLNFVLLTLLGVAYQGSGFAFVWVVLHRFHTIAGWSFPDIVLLYSLRLLAHAAWQVPFNQVQSLDDVVCEGRFDRILVRPLNPLLQVVTARFQMNVLGDLVTGIGFFVAAASMADVSFSPLHVLYLVLAVVGGALAEGAFVLAVSSLGFRFLRTRAAMRLLDNVYLMFGSYPTRIFGQASSWVLTWVIPVAFVAYIPSGVLLGRTEALSVSPVLAWAAPAFGVCWFYIGYRVWMWQMRGYQSAGS